MEKKTELIDRKTLLEGASPVLVSGTVEDVPLKKVKFSLGGKDSASLRMSIRGKEFMVDDEALGALVNENGLPVSYAHKVPASLLLPHLNYFFDGEGSRGGAEIRLLHDDKTIFGVSSKTHIQYVSLEEILESLEEAVGFDNIRGYHLRKCTFGWRSSEITLVENKNFKVFKDDLLHSGIRVEHSPKGICSSRVSAYVYRLVCTNGATTMDSIDAFSRRGSTYAGFKDWLTGSVKAAHKSLEIEFQRIKKLTTTKVGGEVSTVLDSVLQRSGIPAQLREEVRTVAIDQNVETLYDVYNVITNVATHSEFFQNHPNAMRQLEEVAGRLTNHGEICPSCHRVK